MLLRRILSLLVTVACCSPALAVVSFEWATVGNPGNEEDTRYALPGLGFGNVNYSYRISKHEVTNAQYVEFLNAVDPTGSNADLGYRDGFLYNENMAGNLGGIEKTGTIDGARYVSKAGREQKPVTYVSFFDAMRFINWLHNGQGSGDTENGTYSINTGSNEVRAASARYWIPSEDEWYKAAYYDPIAGLYYEYPNKTDTEPYSDNPSSVNTPDDTKLANFYKDDLTENGYDDGFAVTGSTSYSETEYYLTDVGAYSLATGPYGTYDQGGNVEEWIEQANGFARRSSRGGAAGYQGAFMRARLRSFASVTSDETQFLGFRVAAAIPEPTTLTQAALACLGLVGRRIRNRS